jgi:hypothetical protein
MKQLPDESKPTTERLLQKLEFFAVPMDECDFSRENYAALFPRGTVDTPIGEVKLGKNQLVKLAERRRTNLLGAMKQTLHDPVFIIRENAGGSSAFVFIKSFKKPEKTGLTSVMSAVVVIGDEKIAISTYKRKVKEMIRKIKKADGIVYEKSDSGGLTGGNDSVNTGQCGNTSDTRQR